jgi:uncharacterized protein (DUF934 family)
MTKRIIRDRAVVSDDRPRVADDTPLPAGPVFVSLDRWEAEREALSARGDVGVVVGGDVDLEGRLAPVLEGLDAVAVEIPKFTDGRAYTLGRLLRERFGFRGELRAVGHVLRDQLFFLHRCGFTAFELAAGKDVDDALAAFDEITEAYQPAVDRPEPLWKRRREARR